MEEHQQMVNDCIDRQEDLSEWEENFIQSISDQLGNGKSLTEKQEEILNRIWNRIT